MCRPGLRHGCFLIPLPVPSGAGATAGEWVLPRLKMSHLACTVQRECCLPKPQGPQGCGAGGGAGTDGRRGGRSPFLWVSHPLHCCAPGPGGKPSPHMGGSLTIPEPVNCGPAESGEGAVPGRRAGAGLRSEGVGEVSGGWPERLGGWCTPRIVRGRHRLAPHLLQQRMCLEKCPQLRGWVCGGAHCIQVWDQGSEARLGLHCPPPESQLGGPVTGRGPVLT